MKFNIVPIAAIVLILVFISGCVEQQQLVGNDSCSDYSFSTCPEGCTQICTPSVCSADSNICTTDCDGPGSCVAGEIG